MKNFFDIQQKGNVAEVYIYGDIVKYPYFDSDQNAARLVDQLKNITADEIHVHIDSCGGSIGEGWGMYTALKQHKAKIVTYADGFVASAALYPFLAGDQRIAGTVSAFFLHQGMTYAEGYAEDLRSAADEIEKLTKIGIQAFVESAGMEEATVQQLMDNETWLTPQEALSYGICTEVATAAAKTTHSQSARAKMVQKLTAPKQQEKQPKPAENPIIKMFC